jgi:Phosphatase
VTRRPKSRLPPKLPDPARDRVRAAPKQPSRRERLKDAHVAGRSVRFTRDDIVRVMRALVHGERAGHLGLDRFDNLTMEHTAAAARHIFGWDGDGPRARIDPARTVEGFGAACARVLEVARDGGALAFATARPASLLGVHQRLVAAARAEGGRILSATHAGPFDARGHRIWWTEAVATVTDGDSLLAQHATEAAEELLFVLPRPDLVVADGGFAGHAAAVGIEVVAFADLDAIALAVAAWRGMPVRIVPLDERRAPHLYAPLLELLDEQARSDGGVASVLPRISRTGGSRSTS